MAANALVIRVKFPSTYPLIYKTLRVNANLTVSETIDYISRFLHVSCGSNIGLYLPDENAWLDNNNTLNSYPEIQDEEYIEYKDKLASKKKGSCIIL